MLDYQTVHTQPLVDNSGFYNRSNGRIRPNQLNIRGFDRYLTLSKNHHALHEEIMKELWRVIRESMI